MCLFGANYWYDLTFLQYIIVSVAVIFVFSMLLSILTMVIFSIVPNRIVLVAVQIVVAFIMIAGVAVCLVQNLIHTIFPPWFVPTVCAIITIVVGMFMLFVWKKENKKDIV